MPLLIDGHNLIPKIPGINLSDLDDEMHLVKMLQDYARIRRLKQVECFFDKAPIGHPRKGKFGTIQVQFARPGLTADAEIEGRLHQLGRQARNWIVASSDQQVRRAARAFGARDISSEDFAMELLEVLTRDVDDSTAAADPQVSKEEMQMWLELFKSPKSDEEGQG